MVSETKTPHTPDPVLVLLERARNSAPVSSDVFRLATITTEEPKVPRRRVRR